MTELTQLFTNRLSIDCIWGVTCVKMNIHNLHAQYVQLPYTICSTYMHNKYVYSQYVYAQHAYIHSMSIHKMSRFHAGIDL